MTNKGVAEAGQHSEGTPTSEAALGSTSDFSPVACRYDATRDLPMPILLSCYDRLIERRLFPTQGTVLDAGCGTGQVSLLLAERGYWVRGVDISAEMVKLVQSKVSDDSQARYEVGDVCDLPFEDGVFDAVSSRNYSSMSETGVEHVAS
jgi:ubiquinone/menaquinone biosynthesis C-methylase UbiE